MYDCVVCFDMTQDARPSVNSCCCHSIVCQSCLNTWTGSNTNCPACRRNGPSLTTIKLKSAEELFREVKRFQANESSLSLRPQQGLKLLSPWIGSSLRPFIQGSSTPITSQTSNPQIDHPLNVSNGDLEDIIFA